LIINLESEDNLIVSEAISVLGQIKDHRAIDSLAKFLGNDSSSMRKKAAKALVNIGDEALPLFLDNLQSSDVTIRRISSWILPDFGNPRIDKYLFDAMGDEDPVVRRNIARAIGVLDVDGSVDCLRKALSDEDWRVRMWAAYSLGLITRKTGATRSLLRAINDKSIPVQCAAMTALGDNGSVSAVGRLLIKLKSNDDLLRDAAIGALGNIGSRKAIEPLLELYKNGDFYAKSGVLLALGSFGGSSKIYNVLEKALPDKDLYQFAVTSLKYLRTDKAERLLAQAK
jgi:HEAT repeat protein